MLMGCVAVSEDGTRLGKGGRVIGCRPRRGLRPVAGIIWDDLTGEKIAAILLLSAQRAWDR